MSILHVWSSALNLTLTDLVGQAHEGVAGARRKLIEQLLPRIARMAAHYARHSEQRVEDLEQEAWLGLCEALLDVNPRIGQPEHYLLLRARGSVLDALRRARIRRCEPLEAAPEPSAPPVDDTLADFFETLGSTQRKVALGLLKGLTFRELGEELACSSANIAYHVRKVREHYACWSGDGDFSTNEASNDIGD